MKQTFYDKQSIDKLFRMFRKHLDRYPPTAADNIVIREFWNEQHKSLPTPKNVPIVITYRKPEASMFKEEARIGKAVIAYILFPNEKQANRTLYTARLLFNQGDKINIHKDRPFNSYADAVAFIETEFLNFLKSKLRLV
jgi:hypothetical protein